MVTSEKSESPATPSSTSDKKNEALKTSAFNTSTMQLPSQASSTSATSAASAASALGQPVVTSYTAVGPQPANGSGYRPQRPRGSKNNPVGGASSSNQTTTLPASAASAAPYVPPSYQQQHHAQQNADYMHHHHHVTYAYEAPPPPMSQPPPGWIPAPQAATPYFYEQGAQPPPHPQGPGNPPYVPHMCTMPPPTAPHVVVSSGNKPLNVGGKGGQGATSPASAPSAIANTVNAISSTVVSSSESVQHQQGGPVPVHGPQEYEVEYHLHQGEVISLQLGDGRVQIIPGK